MLRFVKNERWYTFAPFLFLAASILAYGLQIPWLGFYLDDWVILNAYNTGGAERVFEYAFRDNRPLVSWVWILTFQLFGTSAVPLQIWSLFWRWMSVVAIWLGWRELWPNASRQTAIAGLLFAVYPLFRQQPTAVAYVFHWLCLFLFGLSIYAMLRAVRPRAAFLPWMALSVVTGAVTLFTQEFYVGIELLRPLMLWMVLHRRRLDHPERWKRVLLAWLPFVLLMAGYLVWRLVLMPTPGTDRNIPIVLYDLFTSPLATVPKLITMVLQDLLETVVGAWYRTIDPSLFVFAPFANLAAWALTGVVFVINLLIFRWDAAEGQPQIGDTAPWYRTAIPYSLVAMLLGFAPGWSISKQVYNLSGMYNDRFGLAATFGAAVLITALAEVLLKNRKVSLAMLCLLIGLGVGQNFRFVTSYRYSWEKQRQLYWQLKWRAPSLQPDTAIISDGALVSYTGSWVTTSSFLQMYASDRDSHFAAHWYFDAYDMTPDQIQQQENVLTDARKYMRFTGLATDSLVISFHPEQLQCLWVLSERDASSRTLPDPLRAFLPYSNLDRILREPDLPLRADVFGPEIERDWCYYFQKADLAAQYNDWETVVRLWGEADQNGKYPRNGVEYRPFIRAFAHTGDWKTAAALTKKAAFPYIEMRGLLCGTWWEIAIATPESAERSETLAAVMQKYECQDDLGDLVGPQ